MDENGVLRRAAWQDRALDRTLAGSGRSALGTAMRAVAAARALASETGTPSFTVAQIVARSGVSLKAFYRCFAGKDDVLLALFEEDARRGAEALAAAAARHRLPMRRLRACVEGLFAIVVAGRDRRGYMAVLVGEHHRLARERPADLRAVLAPFVDVLEREIAGAMAAGAVRAGDARRDAVAVLHLVTGHIQAVVLGEVEDDASVVGAYLWEFCRAALAPRPGGAGPSRR